MPSLTFVVAGRLDTRTGGSIYNRRMAEALVGLGWTVDVRELDGPFPFPATGAACQASKVMTHVHAGECVLIDGLAFGSMPDVLAEASHRLRIVALVHLPLAAEIGLTSAMQQQLAQSEQRALSCARLVVVTGASTKSLMVEYGLEHPNVVVVEPGTDPAPLSKGSGSTTVHLLTVAAITPGKGVDVLIDALASTTTRQWRLTCAGSLSRSPETVTSIRAAIARHQLDEHVRLADELNDHELGDCYDQADVVVSASLRETYGMAVAEALARGLPVVATATGAVPELLADGAGIVVPPGDRHGLADALSRVIDDAACRARCAAGARRVRDRLPDWNMAASRLAAALTG